MGTLKPLKDLKVGERFKYLSETDGSTFCIYDLDYGSGAVLVQRCLNEGETPNFVNQAVSTVKSGEVVEVV